MLGTVKRPAFGFGLEFAVEAAIVVGPRAEATAVQFPAIEADLAMGLGIYGLLFGTFGFGKTGIFAGHGGDGFPILAIHGFFVDGKPVDHDSCVLSNSAVRAVPFTGYVSRARCTSAAFQLFAFKNIRFDFFHFREPLLFSLLVNYCRGNRVSLYGDIGWLIFALCNRRLPVPTKY